MVLRMSRPWRHPQTGSRHASVQTQLQQRWRAARTGVVTLSNRDVHALAGIWYRDLVTTRQDDPDDPDMLDIYQDHLRDGVAFLDPESDGIERRRRSLL